MSASIVKYFDVYTPCTVCQFACSYCYIRQRPKVEREIGALPDKEVIREAFSKERMGGSVLLNLCAAGETLLSPEIPWIVKELVDEGHFFSIVTNGITTKAFDELLGLDIPMDHLFFKFSFHYLELMRTKTLSVFISNVHRVAASGASYTVEMLACDEYAPHIEEIQKICMDSFGALPHLSIPRDDRTAGIDLITDMPIPEYKRKWNGFSSELFRFKMELLHKKRTEYCRAGEYSYVVNLQNGEIRQCLAHAIIGNLYQNLNKPFPVRPVGKACVLPYCYNGHVFLALGDIKTYSAPTYYEVRNRVTKKGGEWVKGKIKDIFSGRLYETNYK